MMPEVKTKTIRLRVHANGDDAEQVIVNVNGKCWIVQREEDIDAPEELVEALRLATRPIKRVMTDPHSGKETEFIEHVPRFPFSIG